MTGQLAFTLADPTAEPSAAPWQDGMLPPPVLAVAGDQLVEQAFRAAFERAMQEEPRFWFAAGSDLVDRSFCHYFFRDAALYHANTRYVIQEKQFERILGDALRAAGRSVWEPPSLTHPYDLLLEDTGERISAKTETQKKLRPAHITLSKILECGDEQIPRDPAAAIEFSRTTLADRLGQCDRMLVLRAHPASDERGRRCLRYEIIEVPKTVFALLAEANADDVSQKGKMLTLPLHADSSGVPALEVKFDGSVHKVAIRNLRIDACVRHAVFLVPYGDEIRSGS